MLALGGVAAIALGLLWIPAVVVNLPSSLFGAILVVVLLVGGGFSVRKGVHLYKGVAAQNEKSG